MQKKVIACIDLKAFYASVECIDRGLDPFTTPLVVCDTERGMGTIILSVSPFLKEKGVPSRLRRRDLPHVKDTIFAVPRMQKYIEKSCEILSIIMRYVSDEDIHVYSIDECFLNIGPYLELYNKSADELVAEIQDTIKKETGLTSTAGISYNVFMAKVALDVDAKNYPPHYRVYWGEDAVKNKLWKLPTLSSVWGISKGYEARLNKLGIKSIEQLANTPKSFLKQHLGIIGEQLWDLSNGIDESDIRNKYVPMSTSFSCGHSLHKDFSPNDVRLLLREICDELCIRLHNNKMTTKLISLTIIYSYSYQVGGFTKQMTLDTPSDVNDVLFKNILEIYDNNIKNIPIRKVYLCFSKLSKADFIYQNLFENDEIIENRNMNMAIENIKKKYGLESISRTSALLNNSVFKQRSNQIGGHKK